MTGLLANLSADGRSNWVICKERAMWGSGGRSSHSKHAVKVARPGDRIYVWQSGSGLLAMAEVTEMPFEFASVSEVPWPEPERYAYAIPFKVLVELESPIADRFEDYVSLRFGIQTYQLQAGFAVLKPKQAQALAEAFQSLADSGPAGVRPHLPTGVPAPRQNGSEDAPPPVTSSPAVKDDNGAPRPPNGDQNERSPVAVLSVVPADSVLDALLALYRQRLAEPSVTHPTQILLGDEADRETFLREIGRAPFDLLSGSVVFGTSPSLGAQLRELQRQPDQRT